MCSGTEVLRVVIDISFLVKYLEGLRDFCVVLVRVGFGVICLKIKYENFYL